MLITSRERRRGRLLRVSRKSGQIFISLHMRTEALNGFKAPNKRQQIIVTWRHTTSSLVFQISLLPHQLSLGEITIYLAEGIGIILTPFSRVLRGQSRANHGGVIKLGQQI